MNISPEASKPGDNVTITINSAPNSYIGLLGVDKSVLLLKKGNDLETQSIFSELDKNGNEAKELNRRIRSVVFNDDDCYQEYYFF